MMNLKQIDSHDIMHHIRIISIPHPDKIDVNSNDRMVAASKDFKRDCIFRCPVCGEHRYISPCDSVHAKRIPYTVNGFQNVRFSCPECGSIFETDPVIIDSGDAVARPVQSVREQELFYWGYFFSNVNELKRWYGITYVYPSAAIIGAAVAILLWLILFGIFYSSGIVIRLLGPAFAAAGGILGYRLLFTKTFYTKEPEEPLHKTKPAP